MRALIGALIFTFAIAVTASVFAIWPVVADAPWEDEAAAVDRTAELRCEGALQLRAAAVSAYQPSAVRPDLRGPSTQPRLRSLAEELAEGSDSTPRSLFPAALQQQLEEAQREIERYC